MPGPTKATIETVVASEYSRETQAFALEDGTTEYEISLGTGEEWWALKTVVNVITASAGGAATRRIYIAEETGFTPGDVDTRYDSGAVALATAIRDIETEAIPYLTDAAGKLYMLIVPDAGTITGDVALDFVRMSEV